MSSRRNFLRNAAFIAGGGMLGNAFGNKAFAYFKNSIAPSDQLNIAVIGINGMGWSNVKAAIKVPGVNLVGLCDVDKNVLDKRLGELASLNINAATIKTHIDYRELLDRKEVDAVIIGTPDHWHALQMMNAC